MKLIMGNKDIYEISSETSESGRIKVFYSKALETPSSEVTHYPVQIVFMKENAIDNLKKLAEKVVE